MITQVACVIRFAKLAFDANRSAAKLKSRISAIRPASAGRAPSSPREPSSDSRSESPIDVRCSSSANPPDAGWGVSVSMAMSDLDLLGAGDADVAGAAGGDELDDLRVGGLVAIEV